MLYSVIIDFIVPADFGRSLYPLACSPFLISSKEQKILNGIPPYKPGFHVNVPFFDFENNNLMFWVVFDLNKMHHFHFICCYIAFSFLIFVMSSFQVDVKTACRSSTFDFFWHFATCPWLTELTSLPFLCSWNILNSEFMLLILNQLG